MKKIKEFLSDPANREVLKYWLFAWLTLIAIYIIEKSTGVMIGNFVVDNPAAYTDIIWLSYAFCSPKFEAAFYKLDSSINDNINQHPLLVLIRCHVLLPLCILSCTWPSMIGMILQFSFIHNGSYYRMRDILDPGTYPKRWLDQSTTSKALLTKYMIPIVRTVLFVIGTALIIFFTNWNY